MSLVATFDIVDSTTSSKKKKYKKTASTTSRQQQQQQHLLLRTSLYLGSKEDAKNMEVLEKRRISHILNVTPSKAIAGSAHVGVPNYFEKSNPKFTYLRIPLFDDATSVKELQSTYATKIVDFIHRGLYHGNVLVHCHHGISRSTTCVALYLMR
jgi:protein-tyrosine phosphatase